MNPSRPTAGRRFRRTVALSLAAVTALAVTACGSSNDSDSTNAAATKDPIKIGYAVALTGPNNAWDGPVLGGAKVAVDDINAKGGVGGRKLELIEVDNKSDLTQVTPAAQQALEKGAEIIVTSYDYDFGSPAARAANAKGVLVVSGAGDPRFGRQGVGPLTFNTLRTTNDEGSALAELAEQKGAKNAYFLVDTTINYSKSLCDYTEQRWKQLGGKVAGTDTFKNSDSSVASQISRLRAAEDADAVFLCSFLPGGPGVVRQIRGAGLDTPIYAPGSFDADAWLAAVPKLSNFTNLSTGSFDGTDGNAEHERLGKRYVEVNGGKPATAYGPLGGYTEIQVIAAAIDKADGSTKGEDLQKALEGAGVLKTISGDTTYTDQCHTPQGREVGISSVQDGKRTFEGWFTPKEVIKAAC